MKLNYSRTILVGFAFLSICAFWQMYDNLVPLMLKNDFGIGDNRPDLPQDKLELLGVED